jgi:hypothetical protein
MGLNIKNEEARRLAQHREPGIAAPLGIACCTSTAQRTASTMLTNFGSGSV